MGVVVLGYKTQRRLGAVIEQLLYLTSLLTIIHTMPLDNTRRYHHTRGGTISRPRFPTPVRGVEGDPYMSPAEVGVFFWVRWSLY